MSYEERLVRMRKENSSYILTLLQEAINWNPNLDEIVVLCDVLRIFDKHNLAVSRNEVRKAFNKYYSKDFHGDKNSYLTWIFKNFHIKDRTRVFTSQVRKKSPLPQTIDTKTPYFEGKNEEMGSGSGILLTYTENTEFGGRK